MPEADFPPPAPRRLRAVTRRVPRRPAHLSPGEDEEGQAEDFAPEPNVRLSRALGVMLLLHVVAAGGVFAFGKIKERPAGVNEPGRTTKTTLRGDRPSASNPLPDHAPTPFPAAVLPPPVIPPNGAVSRALPTPTLSRVEADAVRLIEGGGPNALAGGERSYLVGRGETVQTIAQKLRVEPAALLRLNRIDDPRQIQVGQRLRVPPAPARSRS